ncbi:MAG: hypothetical protein ACKN9T_04560 [Candidatus Methylumidiphilus sp.]
MTNQPTQVDAEKFVGLLDKVFQFAQTAEALAQRMVKAVRNVAVLGVLAAAWLAYGAVRDFALSPWKTLPIGLVLATPALLLGWLYWSLQDALGLPARLRESAAKIQGKSVEAWQSAAVLKANATAQGSKPKLSDLIGAGKAVAELKSHGDEAIDIVIELRKNLLLGNPFALIMMAVAGVAIVAEVLLGLGTGLLRLL